VITQPLSFIATCNAISYIGAVPLFVDIDPATLGLSANALETFLKEKTKVINGVCIHTPTGKKIAACVPMHTFGHPVEIERMAEICRDFSVPLVEDAAESIGSRYKGKHTGTFGLVGAFSFNGNKTITCGGGGVIITNDKSIAAFGKHLTTQAKIPHRWNFEHDHIGYNYRLPNLNAALACAQLEQLDRFVEAKRKLADKYKTFFKELDVTYCAEPENSFSNYWLNAILLDNRESRDAFLAYTNDHGVMTRPVWTLMTKLKMFTHAIAEPIPVSENIESRLVNIPSSVIL
jgi:aminotransferase in exopolysaccharide biosynthesis